MRSPPPVRVAAFCVAADGAAHSRAGAVVEKIGVETKRSKWPAAFPEEVLDTARDQNPNEVVVKRPPSLVTARHGQADEANGIVDHRCHEGERVPELVPRHDERHLRPFEHRLPARQGL